MSEREGPARAEPWYREGLRFQCTRCGNCCRGTGTVLVSEAEIEGLTRATELSDAEFRAVYTRALRDGTLSLREKANRDCVFYDPERGCEVYAQRPRQCRTWPFWRAVVHSRERWEEESRDCPGMGNGRRYRAEEVARLAADDGTSGRLT